MPILYSDIFANINRFNERATTVQLVADKFSPGEKIRFNPNKNYGSLGFYLDYSDYFRDRNRGTGVIEGCLQSGKYRVGVNGHSYYFPESYLTKIKGEQDE